MSKYNAVENVLRHTQNDALKKAHALLAVRRMP